jgi:hypothetical protein
MAWAPYVADITFFKYDRVIRINLPETEASIQDILNQIRDYEDELDFLDYGHIANAYGKQSLGSGAYVGITLELINNWRIQYQDRAAGPTVTAYITGGNLVAINDYDNNPVKPSDYVTVVIAQSTSPSIITPPEDVNMLYLIESLRGKHKSIGSVYYWDPTSGDDANDGTQPGDAVATFAQAQSLCTAGAHDIIFCLSTDSSGVTTVTETLNITVPTLQVRGPGYPFQLIPSSSGTDTITIAADGVSVEGLYVSTAAGGTDNGITVYTASGTVDGASIKDVWINSATGNGIDVSNATRTTIDTCAIEDSTGNGIAIGDSATLSKIKTCIITGNADGVDLAGTGLTDNILENNVIYNNTTNGIDVGSGVVRTGIRLHHTFSGNTTNVNDNGTDTFQDTSGAITAGDIDSIVDGVWDEVIGDHLTAGTTGRTLRDAKTKATLASLK